MNAISINNCELGIKEYNHHRVVTFSDIDNVHQRPVGTARRNFNTNKKHFIENEDYYTLKPNVRNSYIEKIPPKGITLLTETGYLMLVKSFTDDLAWDVQRQLVKTYFRAQQIAPVPTTAFTANYYRGEKVLTIREVEEIFKLHPKTVIYHLKERKELINGLDYRYLRGAELLAFKNENDHVYPLISKLYIVYQTGIEKLLNLYNRPDQDWVMMMEIFKDNQRSAIKNMITNDTDFKLYEQIMGRIMDEMSKEWDYSTCIATTNSWFNTLKREKIDFQTFNRLAESITESQSVYEVSGFKMGFKAAMMFMNNNLTA